MNGEKRSILRNLNPLNFTLGNKLHLLIFSLVLLTFLMMGFLGFSMLHTMLIKGSSDHLNDISQLKVTELEVSKNSLHQRFRDFTDQEKVRYAAEEFTTAFRELSYSNSDLPELDQIRKELSDFYMDDIAPLSPFSGDHILQYLPSQDLSLIAQYKYVYLNPKPIGEKDKFISAEDYSGYSNTHGSYHSYFEKFRSFIGAKDLFLVDPESGDIVYSVNKNIDFGTNLYDGPFKNEPVSMAFRKAVSESNAHVSYTDYTNYPGAFDKPAAFISIPLLFFNELVTVVILEFSTDFIDNLLFDEYALSREGSLTYDIVGDDLQLRNNPEIFIKDKEAYLDKLKRKAGKRELEKIIQYEKTGAVALYTHYDQKYSSQFEENKDVDVYDYNSKRVLAHLNSFDFFGVNYILVTKINRSQVLLNFVDQMKTFAVLIFLLLIIIFFIGKYVGKTLSMRIRNLLTALVELYKGEKSRNVKTGSPDEFGETVDAFNLLRKRINSAEEFALEMSEGNYNYTFEILGDKDSLGKSLNVLKDRLIKSREEEDKRKDDDETRNWINTGIAKFNDLLRTNNDNIKALSYSIIENLIEYLNANQGGVFFVEGESESEKKIELIASYAYNREKYMHKSLDIGEGLLGTVYMEKKSKYLKDIPEDYIEITSGLGQASPRVLYIVPLKVDENVLGMIEIATFNEFESHHIDFIEKVAESIAATFVSVRLNMKTALLLDESNRKAEEIAQQEEEMRQNLEEMQATQEELARLRQDDEKRTREMQVIVDNTRNLLKNLTNSIPGGILLKDANGVIHFINEEGAEFYNASVDKVIGKTDLELLDSKTHKSEHERDESVLKDGDIEYTEEREVKGKSLKFRVLKKRFQIEEIHQTGVLTIRIKV